MAAAAGPNFDLIAAHQPAVEFIAMRTGQSWGYRDPAFSYYLAEAQRIGACILPYHVVFPWVNCPSADGQLPQYLGRRGHRKCALGTRSELDHSQTRGKSPKRWVSA